MKLRIKIYELDFFLTCALIGINILFPKAGIKLHGIPITLGSVVLFLLIVKVFLFRLNKVVYNSKVTYVFIIGELYWISIYILSFVIGKTGISVYLDFIVSLNVFVLSFFIVHFCVTSERDIEKIFSIIRVCVFLVMAYALLQLVFGIGKVDIPGLTVNYSDWKESPDSWWLLKFNNVGEASKVFSTYQNGNILGVNLLILFPLVFNTIKKKWIKVVTLLFFAGVIFFSGSRTALVGMLLWGVVWIAGRISNRISRYTFILVFVGIIAAIIIFPKILARSSDYVARMAELFDLEKVLTASNRTAPFIDYLKWMFEDSYVVLDFLFGTFGRDYSGTAYEMLYGRLFIYGGIVGVILFLLPFIIYLRRVNNQNVYERSIKEGLIVYLIIAIVEGALWLPPTAIILYSVLALGYRANEMQNRSIGQAQSQ